MQPQEPAEQPFQPQPEAPSQPEQPGVEQWRQPEVSPGAPHVYEGPVAAVQPVEDSSEPKSVEPVPRQPLEGEEEAVRWQANEYIQRDKDAQWFIIFGVVAAALLAVAILLMRSWSFAALIVVIVVTVVVMNRRPPMVYSYTLSRKGLHIDDRLYPYTEFKEFGLVTDDEEHSIMLVPRKRFRSGVTVYFPEEAGEAIVDTLAARLPMKQIRLDPIDKLVRKLRI